MIDGMTSPIHDLALREKIKAAILRTPQYVSASEMEATLDPELWKPDKINVPVLMILAKRRLGARSMNNSSAGSCRIWITKRGRA